MSSSSESVCDIIARLWRWTHYCIYLPV